MFPETIFPFSSVQAYKLLQSNDNPRFIMVISSSVPFAKETSTVYINNMPTHRYIMRHAIVVGIL